MSPHFTCSKVLCSTHRELFQDLLDAALAFPCSSPRNFGFDVVHMYDHYTLPKFLFVYLYFGLTTVLSVLETNRVVHVTGMFSRYGFPVSFGGWSWERIFINLPRHHPSFFSRLQSEAQNQLEVYQVF